MKNVLIIGLIVVSIGYMFSILFDRYENIKSTQETQVNQQQKAK